MKTYLFLFLTLSILALSFASDDEYEFLDTYIAGIVLSGSEIKSIRLGKASITESFCEFNEQGELFVINMQTSIVQTFCVCIYSFFLFEQMYIVH